MTRVLLASPLSFEDGACRLATLGTLSRHSVTFLGAPHGGVQVTSARGARTLRRLCRVIRSHDPLPHQL